MSHDSTPEIARLEADAARWEKLLREIEDHLLRLQQIQDMGGQIYDDSTEGNLLPEKLKELSARWRNVYEKWSPAVDKLYDAYVKGGT